MTTERSSTPDRQCPELGAPCDKKYSCEHTKRCRVVICMRANVRRWINEEPPFGTNKPEKRHAR